MDSKLTAERPSSPSLLKTMLDATTDIIVAKDAALGYLAVNAAFTRFFGVAEEAAIGMCDHHLLPEAQASLLAQHARQVMNSGVPVAHEAYLAGAQDAGWFQITTFPRSGTRGDIDGVLVTLRDITRHRRAEDSLRTHAARYATLLATSQDGFWSLDRSGRLRDVNDAYCRMSGYTREELLRMHIADLDAQETANETARQFELAIRTGFQRFETRHRRKDGTRVDVEVSASFWAETGKFLAFFRDITERRRAQAALKAERQRLLAILDALPIYLLLLTPDYHVAFANGYFRKRFGDPKGQRCHKFLFGKHEPCSTCRSYDVLSNRQPLEWEWEGPDGRHYYVYDFPFTDTDGSAFILEAGLDITDLKHAEGALRQLNVTLEQRVVERTEALAAVNRELESFSYSVSHDLRGPLRAINGFSQALADDYAETLDESGRLFLERIQLATLRMSQLIDGLLMLSRVYRSDIAPVNVDLSELAHDVLRQLREEQKCDADIVIEAGLAARGDKVLLRLLLQNLLGNAVKFSARVARPQVMFGCTRQDGREVLFVRDNGVGFESELATRLFEPFSRLHAQEGFDGTGIGLATVRRIVQRHGGEIWANGAVDRGATFYFTLPPNLRDDAEGSVGDMTIARALS